MSRRHPEPPRPQRSLVIASNRLPVSLEIGPDGWTSRTSAGGLASALSGVTGTDRVTWVGWPGCEVPEAIRDDVRAKVGEDHLVPVFLDAEQEEHFYHGISNQVLWPLFHYFTEKVDFQGASWNSYVQVNRLFADEVLKIVGPDAQVWVHDFHLMLVPQMLREARPDLEIGFFLHIPFPSSELYRLLPAREELMKGLLGADYIGFHVHDYGRHFRATCLRVLGLETEHDELQFEGRRVGLGVHPIGIDVKRFERILTEASTCEVFEELQERYRGRKVILGVERLDYTKGIVLKLQAFERLLEKYPEIAHDVTLLQVIVPSRSAHPDYIQLKREIEEYIGRINGKFGDPGRTPIEYMHRNLTPEQLVALYRYVDVCLVSPIRDGMNLVAQEFVLCQSEVPDAATAYRGALVLSEFAGAAQCLPYALLTNPWDVDGSAATLVTALQMRPEEKAERLAPMVDIVRGMECTGWAGNFLSRLSDSASTSRRMQQSETLAGDIADEVCRKFAAASERVVFLDYDGTLRELERTPEEAAATPEILDLLARLTALPSTTVHIVSGRHRQNLHTWFGDLPVHLSAEHGFSWRQAGSEDWYETPNADLEWIPLVQDMLLDVAEEVPGTRLERKPCALAWHYRMADLDYGVWRARELHSQLEDTLSHLPVDIIHGHRVIEVRAAGVHKGRYVARVLESTPPDAFVLCIGDDRTDLDMYRVLPEVAIGVHVGGGTDVTRYTLASPKRVRAFLTQLAKQQLELAPSSS